MEDAINLYGFKLSKKLVKFMLNGEEKINHKKIHSFRLSIKRLSVLLKLLFLLSEKKKSTDLLLPFNEVYKSSGRYRNKHIQRQIINAYESEFPRDVKLLIKQLKVEEKNAASKLTDSLKKVNHKAIRKAIKCISDSVKVGSEKITFEKCIEYINSEVEIITQISARRIDEKALHKLRKQIKGVVYSLELLNNSIKLSHFYKNVYEVANILQDELGQLNDRSMLLKSIRKLYAKSLTYNGLEWVLGVDVTMRRTQIVKRLAEAQYAIS